MAFTEYAKVKNVLVANTKFGKRKVCNVITDQGDEAIWAEDLSAFKHIKAGQQIEVIRGVKGSLTILERSAPSPASVPLNQNGKGLQQINQPLERVLDELNIDLPQPLSDRDKVKLSKLIRERAKLLTHTIEVMRDELNDKGLEFHEGSIRSLSVSLFIHISRHLD